MFKVGDKAVYQNSHPAMTKGKTYEIQWVSKDGSYVDVMADYGGLCCCNAIDFSAAPRTQALLIMTARLVKIQTLQGGYPALPSFTVGKPYKVRCHDLAANTIELEDDNGTIRHWHTSFFDIFGGVRPDEGPEDKDKEEPDRKESPFDLKCVCSMRELMMHGCKCGAIDAEKRKKEREKKEQEEKK